MLTGVVYLLLHWRVKECDSDVVDTQDASLEPWIQLLFWRPAFVPTLSGGVIA